MVGADSSRELCCHPLPLLLAWNFNVIAGITADIVGNEATNKREEEVNNFITKLKVAEQKDKRVPNDVTELHRNTLETPWLNKQLIVL